MTVAVHGPTDDSVIGHSLPSHDLTVEPGRLKFFASVTGQVDPAYFDHAAAVAAGHPNLLIPATFLFCLDMERPDPGQLYRELGIDLRRILHGEERFDYHRLAYAEETLTFATEVTDFYTKKGGALRFLTRTTEVTRQGEAIAQLHTTTVLR